MRHARALPWLLLLFAVSTGTARAAEAADTNSRSEAKERFSRGLHLFENGDNGGALAEFKRAYELIPNPLVLYNIGLVYASMGRPVEAVQSLDKMLADPGPLKAEQLTQARTTRDEQERRIGRLEVRSNVPAAIEVDGVKVGDAPLPEPVRVAAGEHVVGALAPGYLAIRQTATVAGSASVSLSFELQPTETHVAHVDVRCAVPGAEVFIDGRQVGKTPLAASVAVAPGSRVIEIRRAGYTSVRRELSLSDGARSEVSIDLDESSQPGAEHGRLRLAAEEGDIVVTINGRTRGVYRGSIELPAGPHVVKLERAGFESLERQCDVPVGGEEVVKVAFRPTVDTRAAYASRGRLVRHFAYGTLITGAIVAAGSTALALWSNDKYSTAQGTLAQVERDATFRGGGGCDRSYDLTDAQIAACNQTMADARNDVDKYHNLRTAGIVGIVGGAALLGTGVALWVWGPDPRRYDREEGLEETRTVVPVVVVTPHGAQIGLRGRF
jgi:hypothetical protein